MSRAYRITTAALMLLLTSLTISSCSREEIPLYSGEEGIYFNKRIVIGNILTDKTEFTFVYTEADEKEVEIDIPIQLVGRVSDSDRPVNIVVSGGDAVEGVDYTLPLSPVFFFFLTKYMYKVTV